MNRIPGYSIGFIALAKKSVSQGICVAQAPSTRIRFHIVFIETTNFSLRFHLASTRTRSETMIVYTENDNFLKRSPKWKDLKTIYVITISLSFRRIVFIEIANF